MRKFFLILFLASFSHYCLGQFSTRKSFVPEWAKDAVYYQIFPERFSNGDTLNDPPDVEKWGGVPKVNNYFGGDLKGIIGRLDYLKELGINAIYLNPIFESNSNHKYHTIDYFKIDRHFGDEKIFKELLDESHKRGIRVVIDGVFNHTGIDFFAFKDIVKNERNSKYLNWYSIHGFPVKLPPQKPNYEAWWGMGELPKLMADNPEVRKHLFDATRYWMRLGLDGWRLDVPNEMSHDFWIEWRKLVKEENPDAIIIGEIWDDASPWLKGDQFDAVMNYRFRGSCVGFIALENRNAFQFDSVMNAVRNEYPPDVNYALQNLIGSHDTERFLTLCGNDTSKLRLALLVQMTFPGSPMVYYGDEIGMTGGKDPACRATMDWNRSGWNLSLWEWYKGLIGVRNKNAVLRRGDIKSVFTDIDKKLVCYLREYEKTTAVVILNNDTINHQVSKTILPDGIATWTDVLSQKSLSGKEFTVDVPARSGVIIIGNR